MSQAPLLREHAEKLDAADPLAGFRDRFALDDPSLVYLNGNSLGALPRDTLRRLEAVIREEWGTALARPGRSTQWSHDRASAVPHSSRITVSSRRSVSRGSAPSELPFR